MSRVLRAMAATAVVVASLVLSGGTAAAHERRTVGPYQFVVGFLDEPAFAGTINGIDLTITDTRANNKNVEGVEKTLTVDVFSGGLVTPLSLPLRARFGLPGKYAADFVPTKSGAYAFVFKGKVESLDVNEKFESGPGRFNDVESTTPVQYPDKVPSGSDLTRQLADLQATADQVRIIAIGALLLGAAAIGLGLWRRRA